MKKNKLLKRTKIVLSSILALMIVFIYFLLGRSSAIPGINLGTDNLKENTMKKIYRQETTEGRILDKNDVVLSEAQESGVTGTLVFPEMYSWLLGYNTSLYGSYGIKGRYENYLYMQGKEKKGADIKLTIDNSIQKIAYNIIRDTDGSMIVLDIHSGKILALASARKDIVFDVNELNEEKMNKWNEIDGLFLPNGYKDKNEPGSVFKVVTASAIIEHKLDEQLIEDVGETKIDNHRVVNAGKRSHGKINLGQALGYSSNIYFAIQAAELGGAVLNAKAEDYLLGKKIELDFTTLESNLDLDNYTKNLVADTGFGQGNTLITPLQIAMIYQSIANDGIMLKPYMVENVKLNNKTLYKGKKEQIAEPISKDTASKLNHMLADVAKSYYGIKEKKIHAKTGTAQLPGNKVKCYFASYNDEYVVISSKVSDDGYGADLKDGVLEMYSYLKEVHK